MKFQIFGLGTLFGLVMLCGFGECADPPPSDTAPPKKYKSDIDIKCFNDFVCGDGGGDKVKECEKKLQKVNLDYIKHKFTTYLGHEAKDTVSDNIAESCKENGPSLIFSAYVEDRQIDKDEFSDAENKEFADFVECLREDVEKCIKDAGGGDGKPGKAADDGNAAQGR